MRSGNCHIELLPLTKLQTWGIWAVRMSVRRSCVVYCTMDYGRKVEGISSHSWEDLDLNGQLIFGPPIDNHGVYTA
jgi:hypothetical protein